MNALPLKSKPAAHIILPITAKISTKELFYVHIAAAVSTKLCIYAKDEFAPGSIHRFLVLKAIGSNLRLAFKFVQRRQ